ncbi:MAG: hypothetical protein JWO00_333 [Candidatus Parcubacteria bacterium]|nr:hypothetical protein [Candidatus Parcubacteria bacterium]
MKSNENCSVERAVAARELLESSYSFMASADMASLEMVKSFWLKPLWWMVMQSKAIQAERLMCEVTRKYGLAPFAPEDIVRRMEFLLLVYGGDEALEFIEGTFPHGLPEDISRDTRALLLICQAEALLDLDEGEELKAEALYEEARRLCMLGVSSRIHVRYQRSLGIFHKIQGGLPSEVNGHFQMALNIAKHKNMYVEVEKTKYAMRKADLIPQ